MVMSFIEGETLADPFEREGPASSEVVRSWMIQAAEALGHAHRAGIIHRDVKPENLMIDQAERIWVIDFGIARFESQAAITRVGTVMGTPLFLSPEQIGGKDPDIRNDVYSLGATAYFMVSGKYPYNLQELIGASVEGPRPLPDHVDPRMAASLLLAVSLHPEDRPSSMMALVEMLR
jgi:serine/threonine-protein kinase